MGIKQLTRITIIALTALIFLNIPTLNASQQAINTATALHGGCTDGQYVYIVGESTDASEKGMLVVIEDADGNQITYGTHTYSESPSGYSLLDFRACLYLDGYLYVAASMRDTHGDSAIGIYVIDPGNGYTVSEKYVLYGSGGYIPIDEATDGQYIHVAGNTEEHGAIFSFSPQNPGSISIGEAYQQVVEGIDYNAQLSRVGFLAIGATEGTDIWEIYAVAPGQSMWGHDYEIPGGGNAYYTVVAYSNETFKGFIVPTSGNLWLAGLYTDTGEKEVRSYSLTIDGNAYAIATAYGGGYILTQDGTDIYLKVINLDNGEEWPPTNIGTGTLSQYGKAVIKQYSGKPYIFYGGQEGGTGTVYYEELDNLNGIPYPVPEPLAVAAIILVISLITAFALTRKY